MPRLCFTITALRSQSTIRDFKHLLDKKLFQGIEIFYPYQLDELGMERYRDDIKYITENKNSNDLYLCGCGYGAYRTLAIIEKNLK